MNRHIRVWAAVLAACLLIGCWHSPLRDTVARWAGMQDVALPRNGEMQLHVLSVGNADAILIRTATVSVLIDAGENDDEQTVTGYLHRQRVDRPDLLIASHADSDHIGGMDAVVDSAPPKAAWLAFGSTANEDARRLFSALKTHGVTPVTPPLFSTHTVGDLTIEVLGPYPSAKADNDRSLIVRVTFGNVSCLLAGDISSDTEAWLVQSGRDLSADVFKAVHHGAAESNSDALLDAVNPSVAVISCGQNNPNGHPDSAVLSRLNARGVTVYRTDVNGTVVLTTDGEKIW